VRVVNNAFGCLQGVAKVIPREILIKKLSDFVQQKVKFIIVSSPAGTGKTSAVSLLKDQLKEDDNFMIQFRLGKAKSCLQLLADSKLVIKTTNGEMGHDAATSWHGKRIIFLYLEALEAR